MKMKHLTKISFSVLFIICLNFGASAQSAHPIDMAIDSCVKMRSGTLELIQCELEGYENWNAEMEKLYKLLMEELELDAQKVLQQQQESWIKTRDFTFKFQDKFYGTRGLQWAKMMASSKTDIVRKRAIELQIYLNVIDED